MKTEIVCSQDPWPLLPDGKYEAVCTGYDHSFVLGKSRKLYLHFQVTQQGPHYGKKVFMAFNVPFNMKIRPGSKYYKTYVQVNGDKPSRNSQMSPKIFRGNVFSIKTRTTKPKYPNGKNMPETHWYSVVDYIDGVIA